MCSFRFDELDGSLKSNWRGVTASPKNYNNKASMITQVNKNDGLYEICTIIKPDYISITLPLRTLSPNQSEPWRKRYAREKAQRRAVMFAMIEVKNKVQLFALPGRKFNLIFTRYAPKFLDAHDNLPMSMKKIVDQTCAEIVCDYVPGRADSYDCFTFRYNQVKTKGKDYAVKIEIIF